MFRTLIADTVEEDGGDRGLLFVVALVALGLVVAGLRRRGGSESEEEDAIDRIEVSADEERGSADTSGSGIDRVTDEEEEDEAEAETETEAETEAEATGDEAELEDGDESEDDPGDDDLTVEVTNTVSRFGEVDAVDWVMVLAAGVRAMREELEARRGD